LSFCWSMTPPDTVVKDQTFLLTDSFLTRTHTYLLCALNYLQPGAPYDSNGSKKAGVLAIVNELFAIYFRLNNLRLCKNLIRPVETRKLNENGTMGDMVAYRYFIGRLNMFEDKHGLSEENLDYAFAHCHRNALGNKQRILRYLIPVKLYRGRLPTPYCTYLHPECVDAWRGFLHYLLISW
jgi:hypothetical protein